MFKAFINLILCSFLICDFYASPLFAKSNNDMFDMYKAGILQGSRIANTPQVKSNDDDGIYGSSELDTMNPPEYRASSPQCGLTVGEILFLLATPIGAFTTFKVGRALSRWGTPSMKAAGIALMTAGSATFLAFLLSSVAAGCLFSFVRNPAAHYSEYLSPNHPDYAHRGKMKRRISDENAIVAKFEPTDKIWDADPAPYSDKIVVCVRTPNLITFSLGCNNNSYLPGIDSDLYKGENTRLCKEEWQNLGIAGFKEDGKWKVRSKNKPNFTFEDKSLYVDTLEWYKNWSGPTRCTKPMNPGESATISLYSYRITKSGSRICAWLVGIGAVPHIRQYNVGCHWTDDRGGVYPLCSKSVPIREDGNWDLESDTIIPGTGEKKIIGYDDSPCYGCVTSSACIGKDLSVHKSFIPITSVVYRCIKESVSRFIYGCSDESSGEIYEKSYVAVIQERLRQTIKITISLGIAFFALSIVLGSGGGHSPQSVVFFGIKIAAVMFFTYTDPNGVGGLQTFSQGFEELSSGLAAIVAESSVANNGYCFYNDDGYIVTKDGETKDYRYLKVWDMLDCRLMYYFGAPLLPVSVVSGDGNASIGAAFVLNVILLIAAIILGGPFIPLLLLALGGFVILTISLILWIFELTVMSMVAYYVIVLVSPIFIPLSLFGPTSRIFDSWLRQGIAYLIFPVILVAYLGFIMASFDSLFFGNTKFEPKDVYIFGKKATYFFVSPQGSCQGARDGEVGSMPCGCDPTSIGCFFSKLRFYTTEIMFKIKATGFDAPPETDFAELSLKIFSLIVMSFLYTHFTLVILGIASELSGGSRVFSSMGSAAKSAQSWSNSMSQVVASRSASLGKLTRKVGVSDSSDGGGGDGGGDGGGGDGGGDGGGGRTPRSNGGQPDNASDTLSGNRPNIPNPSNASGGSNPPSGSGNN